MFIVLEGIDGCGKTSLARRLAEHFVQAGRRVLSTKQPGGTLAGQRIKQLFLDQSVPLPPRALFFLALADRAAHAPEIVRAVAEGTVVICDRWWPSTVAYQCRGPEIMDLWRRLGEQTAPPQPDLIALLDVPGSVGLQRSLAHKSIQGRGSDRWDSRGEYFLESCRERYLELAQANPRLFRIFDATRPPAMILRELLCEPRIAGFAGQGPDSHV